MSGGVGSSGRGGGGRQSRRKSGRGFPEAGQLLLTGEDLGAELSDARLQVVAQGLRADGALVGGRRPLKEDCGVGRPASFQAVLEASLRSLISTQVGPKGASCPREPSRGGWRAR